MALCNANTWRKKHKQGFCGVNGMRALNKCAATTDLLAALGFAVAAVVVFS